MTSSAFAAASPRSRRLGSQLSGLREAAGLTLAQMASRIGKSTSWVSRVETGIILPSASLIEAIFIACGQPVDHGLISFADQIRTSRSGWWQRLDTLPDPYAQYIGYEAEATVIQQFESTLIPGLCQTEAIARAIITADRSLDPQRVDHRVEARLMRQAILYREPLPEYKIIMMEAALQCKVGTSREWRGQLEHLVKLATQPNIDIQILPFTQNLGAHGAFTVLYFGPDDPPLGCIETLVGSLFVESGPEVAVLSARHDKLASRALPLSSGWALANV